MDDKNKIIERSDIGKQLNTDLIMALNCAKENLEMFIDKLNNEYKPKQVTDTNKQGKC